jgi:hypothetical protein
VALKSRKDAEFEIVDIEDYKPPVLDEPVSPRAHQYGKSYTKTVALAVSEQGITLGCMPASSAGFRRSLKSLIV